MVILALSDERKNLTFSGAIKQKYLGGNQNESQTFSEKNVR